MNFFAILKHILKFLYQNGKHSCLFFTIQSTVFSQCIKINAIICYYLSQHCPLCALVSVNLIVSERWVHGWGQSAVKAASFIVQSRGRVSHARLHVWHMGHGLDMPCVWSGAQQYRKDADKLEGIQMNDEQDSLKLKACGTWEETKGLRSIQYRQENEEGMFNCCLQFHNELFLGGR